MKYDLEHLDTLRAVIDEESFEGAAVALGITSSAVSQRIKALEQSVGTVLVRRSRPPVPTPAALPLLTAARQIRTIVQTSLTAHAPAGQNRPAIPIAANSDSLETWLVPALASVSDLATFHIIRDDQDHTTDYLRSGHVMAGITSTATPVHGCEVHFLGSMKYLAVASPEFAKRYFSRGLTKKSVSAAPIIYFDKKDTLQNEYLASEGLGQLDLAFHYMPSNQAFMEAVRQGLGWGLLPEFCTTALLENGEAVELGGHITVPLYWQQWKISSPALDALRTAALSAARYALT